MLRVAKFDRYDMVNSPLGDKPAFTIWFSGCNKHCEGCQNPELWDSNFGKEFTAPDMMQIINVEHNKLGFEDVVLLGGEPLQQPEDDIIFLCERLHHFGYNIWLYTGYEFEEVSNWLKSYLYTIKCGTYDAKLRV